MNLLTDVALPVITATVASGIVVGLLTLRAQRRQINAGASAQEATALDVLTGTALKMVQDARSESLAAKSEAIQAREDATAARRRAEAAEERAADAARAATDCARQVMECSAYSHTLEGLLVGAGIPLPRQ